MWDYRGIEVNHRTTVIFDKLECVFWWGSFVRMKVIFENNFEAGDKIFFIKPTFLY